MDLIPIGRYARTTGLSVRALRLYDKLGLLAPAMVDFATGYRYYSPDQIAMGCHIRFLRSLRLPLTDIQLLLSAETPDAVQVLENHRWRMATEIGERYRILRSMPDAEKYTCLRREATMDGKQTIHECSFCGKKETEVRRMIAGPKAVIICDECVVLCNRVIAEEDAKASAQ